MREAATCERLKTITLPEVHRSHRDFVCALRVPEAIAEGARAALERMVAIV